MIRQQYSISVRPDAGATSTVCLRGEFDLDACDDLRTAVLGLVTAGENRHIVIDLADVTFIDSETLRAILDGYVAARSQGISYRLVNAHGLVQRVLEVTGLTELMQPDGQYG